MCASNVFHSVFQEDYSANGLNQSIYLISIKPNTSFFLNGTECCKNIISTQMRSVSLIAGNRTNCSPNGYNSSRETDLRVGVPRGSIIGAEFSDHHLHKVANTTQTH